MVLQAIHVIHKRIYFIIRDLCEIKVHHSNFPTIPLLVNCSVHHANTLVMELEGFLCV